MPVYSLFGLQVDSEIPLPELLAAETGGTPDITIRRGTVANGSNVAGLHKAEDTMIYVVPDTARYRIAGGSEITVEPRDGVPDRNVRLYLLGSAFGALLHQRGLFPLHANAVEIEGRAVAFMGSSGAGKSSLAAWLHDRGFRLISDDVCVVEVRDGRAFAAPGLPRLRLWQDALEASGRDATAFDRSYAGADDWNKFDVLTDRVVERGRATPLAALFDLQTGSALKIEQLAPLAATDAVFANTYRGAFVEAVGRQGSHWQTAIDLIRSLPVYAVERRWDPAKFDEDCDRLLAKVRRLIGNGSLQ